MEGLTLRGSDGGALRDGIQRVSIEQDMSEATIYRPESRPAGFSWGGFSPRAYRDLLISLVSAEMKTRYRFTSIGIGWAVVNPIVMMFVYAFIFGAIFGVDRASYKLFLLAGLLPWQSFSSGLSSSVRSYVTGSDLLRKVSFPSEVVPLASVVSAMLSFCIIFSIYLVYMGVAGYDVLGSIQWVLVAVVLEILFLTGLSLLLSCWNVFVRDVGQIVVFGISVWFFLTPIVYPLARLSDGQTRAILYSNPMAVVVTTIQNAVLRGLAPPLGPLAFSFLLSFLILLGGWFVYRRVKYELPKMA